MAVVMLVFIVSGYVWEKLDNNKPSSNGPKSWAMFIAILVNEKRVPTESEN